MDHPALSRPDPGEHLNQAGEFSARFCREQRKIPPLFGPFFRCYRVTGKTGILPLKSHAYFGAKIQHNSGRKKLRSNRTGPLPFSHHSRAKNPFRPRLSRPRATLESLQDKG
ncbi:MAG: hypothetical protein WC729_09920 [Sphingomonas sp.]|jgi:hypothetical protein|uniref:hypothetical protein n=1 Tax=Sphingomonas sp. TaxID=28214 RepID=UPI0035693173